MSREALRLGGVYAQTDGRSIASNSFQSVLHGFEAVAMQSNVVGIGEVRDRYRRAYLHTGDVLKRCLEGPVDDVVTQRRGRRGLGGMPSSSITVHRPSRFTESNAAAKSIVGRRLVAPAFAVD